MKQYDTDAPADPFVRSVGAFETLMCTLSGGEASAWTHAELEEHLEEAGRELLRQLLQLAVTEAVRGSFDQAHAAVERRCGKVLGKRRLEELLVAAAVDVDDFYHARIPVPCSRDMPLVVQVDGKGVVMRPEALREATRRAATKAASSGGRWRSHSTPIGWPSTSEPCTGSFPGRDLGRLASGPGPQRGVQERGPAKAGAALRHHGADC